MGEYATRLSDGEEIKIGTCEDMYYLRWDQVDQVRGAYSLTSPETLQAVRFRFPFPDEDGTAPGDFDDYDRGIPVWGVKAPEGIDHRQVQFVASAGYNLCIPCPEGAPGATPGMSTTVGGLTVHRNGWKGAVRIVQQRWWNGQLVTVCVCGACGARYRLETRAMALPVLEYLAREAAQRDSDGADGSWYRQIAARILAGYGAPAELAATIASIISGATS